MGGSGSSSGKGGSSGGAGKIALSKIEVSNDEYRFYYGKQPSGRGNWYFDIGGKQYSFNGKYSEASKQAKKMAQTKGYSRIKLMT